MSPQPPSQPSQPQRLASVDEANLVLDHAGQVNVFLVAGQLASGGFVTPDGGADLALLRAAVGERIARLPRLRQAVVGRGHRHSWVPIVPDLDQHVRLAPAVAGRAGLERFCADLMGVPLQFDRPLWELLVVPDAAGGGVCFVLRIHHAVADGMAAVTIARQLFDPAGAEAVAPAPPGFPQSSPSTQLPPSPQPSASGTRRRRPFRTLLVGLHRTRLTLTGGGVGDTVLLGPRSRSRGVAFVDVDLAGIESHAQARGATVNDALLAAVAAGYRAALPEAGEPLPAWLPVSVPVALPRRGGSGNQVGVMLVRLPLAVPGAPGVPGASDVPVVPDVAGVPGADDRLGPIARQTRSEKVEAREQGTLELMRGPVGARIMDRLARRQHLVAGFVTNVPGPSHRLHLAGAAVVTLWPVGVLAANVRLGVAALSHAGRLSCSIHFDAANVPGTVFARAMADELERLSA